MADNVCMCFSLPCQRNTMRQKCCVSYAVCIGCHACKVTMCATRPCNGNQLPDVVNAMHEEDAQNQAVKDKLAWAQKQRDAGKFTVPSTIKVTPVQDPVTQVITMLMLPCQFIVLHSTCCIFH